MSSILYLSFALTLHFSRIIHKISSHRYIVIIVFTSQQTVSCTYTNLGVWLCVEFNFYLLSASKFHCEEFLRNNSWIRASVISCCHLKFLTPSIFCVLLIIILHILL